MNSINNYSRHYIIINIKIMISKMRGNYRDNKYVIYIVMGLVFGALTIIASC